MASIKQALKGKTSYTNKHGVTIPYKDLKKMKRLNDQLNYNTRKTGINTTQDRIKINTLSPNYKVKMANTGVRVEFGKYIRVVMSKPKLKVKNYKEKLKKWQRQANYYKGRLKKHFPDMELNMTELDITNFKASGEKIDIRAIAQFQVNMREAFLENHEGLIPDDLLNKMVEAINNLSVYDIHRIAEDNGDIINFQYRGSGNTNECYSDRVAEYERAIFEATGKDVYTPDERASIDELLSRVQ